MTSCFLGATLFVLGGGLGGWREYRADARHQLWQCEDDSNFFFRGVRVGVCFCSQEVVVLLGMHGSIGGSRFLVRNRKCFDL